MQPYSGPQQNTTMVVQGGPQQQQFMAPPRPVYQFAGRGSCCSCCRGRREGYPATAAIVISSIVLICSVGNIVLNAVGLSIGAGSSELGQGISCGVMGIVVGILGVLAGKTRYAGLIIATLVLTTFGIVIVLSGLRQPIFGLLMDQNPQDWEWPDGIPKGAKHFVSHKDSKLAINSLLLVSFIAELCLCLTLSILSCMGLCKGRSVDHGELE